MKKAEYGPLRITEKNGILKAEWINMSNPKNKKVMKKFFSKSWILNAIVAVIAAVLGIMQEVWLGTPLYFLNAFAVGATYGISLSLCVELARGVFCEVDYKEEWKGMLKNVCYGGIFGIIIALATALSVC